MLILQLPLLPEILKNFKICGSKKIVLYKIFMAAKCRLGGIPQMTTSRRYEES